MAKKKQRKVRFQPKLKGVKRIPRYAGFLKEINDRIEQDMARFNCSASWVVASGMAAVYNIDIMKCWDNEAQYQRRKLRRVK